MKVKKKYIKSQEILVPPGGDEGAQINEREADAYSQYSRDIVSKSCLELSFAL